MAFCTSTDVQNLLSAEGVILRADDNPPSVLGECLDMGDDEINWYCSELYSATALAASDWVRRAAAVVAAYNLCERRGNPVPVGIAQKYDRLVAKLEKVQTGNPKYRIPGIGVKKSVAPVVSNHRATNRPWPRTVVIKAQSTGRPENIRQNVDPFDALNSPALVNYSI